MVRSLLKLLVGAIVGAGALLLVMEFSQRDIKQPVRHDSSASIAPEPELLRCRAELSRRDAELAELRKRIEEDGTAVAPTGHGDGSHTTHEGVGARESADRQASAWRISAIERFVPLSDEQKERLEAKFSEERRSQEEGRESSAESLDEILGSENAQVYRSQVNAAFERVRLEEIERDSVWMARKLGLSSEQESQMRGVFDDVERAIAAEYPPLQLGANETPQKRVVRMIAENKRRVQLRTEKLRQVLPPEQYAEYVRAESESSASDMEVFHGSGDGDQGRSSASASAE